MSHRGSAAAATPKVARPRPEPHAAIFCREFITREYRDATSTSGLPTSSVYPTKDANGNVLSTEYGACAAALCDGLFWNRAKPA